ncbi:hypothetical protein AWB81_04398 [Caballeronia arationis]|jgi:hypothetical protein|uniref:Lipoprotein n=1 Tax=Caballeronia arationis TaxID=1777142 RepID=A0A7Z7IC05_9BURK|nr:hypothetical protein AWB81_04398 [Caballeronia arationis]SOE87945.1 hypothetical protein SAMN05446927_6528 [Caballeronia arationis]
MKAIHLISAVVLGAIALNGVHAQDKTDTQQPAQVNAAAPSASTDYGGVSSTKDASGYSSYWAARPAMNCSPRSLCNTSGGGR